MVRKINKKLAGLLILPAMVCANATFALSDTASQTLEATLGTYLDITTLSDGAVIKATISPDTGALNAALTAKFQVNSNTDSQQLYLQGTTTSQAGSENALFQQGTQAYIVFSNTLTGKIPTAAAVADCKLASPTLVTNANAIAYPLNVTLTNDGSATYDATKNQFNVTAGMGTSVATAATGTTPYADTYSFADNAGTYQAVVTLTSTTL